MFREPAGPRMRGTRARLASRCEHTPRNAGNKRNVARPAAFLFSTTMRNRRRIKSFKIRLTLIKSGVISFKNLGRCARERAAPTSFRTEDPPSLRSDISAMDAYRANEKKNLARNKSYSRKKSVTYTKVFHDVYYFYPT